MSNKATAPTDGPTSLKALTGLRFFAALGVLIYHGTFLTHYPFKLGRVALLGQSAVGLFFVLSGFILTLRYQKTFASKVAWLDFNAYFRARVARVGPMHLLTLFLVTPISLYFVHLRPLLLLLSWVATALLVQVYLPILKLQEVWNGPAWSLANEIVFYAVFPFFMAFVLRRYQSSKSQLRFAVQCYTIEILVYVLFGGYLIYSHFPMEPLIIAIRCPFIRIAEFFVGCALGKVYSAGLPDSRLFASMKSKRGRDLTLIGSMVIVFLLSTVVFPRGPWGTVLDIIHETVFYTPFFVTIILVLASGPTFLSPLLEHPWMQLLGEASYSIYMLHWIPYGTLLFLIAPGTSLPLIVVPVLIVGISLASIACFWWVETPARLFLRGSVKKATA